MGKNMQRLLKFAIQYPTWHTYGKDRSTVSAVNRLCGLGLIKVNGNRQFRLNIDEAYERLLDAAIGNVINP